MSSEELKVVWVTDHRGNVNPYHECCAAKLQLTGSPDGGTYYYTAICHACARWLDSPPPEPEPHPE
ncbi:MAG TPA: hypothetical protein VMV93_10210 [Chloroflexota bacterium]|nr:hypothetical protein [Chloroflexota bacterium]